jgi:hypothetical protein
VPTAARKRVSDTHINRVIEFLDKKVKDASCPICKHVGWTGLGDPSIIDSLVRYANGSSGRRAQFEAYMLYCNNCGFVTHHMKEVVDEGIKMMDTRKEP